MGLYRRYLHIHEERGLICISMNIAELYGLYRRYLHIHEGRGLICISMNKNKGGIQLNINPRLPKGGGYHPQTVCLRLHQNAKQSDPGHLKNLFYILSGHFDENNSGVPP